MRSTAWPITREKKITKVFTTPWIRVSVTMSPLAMWLISWPITASASFSLHAAEQAGADGDHARLSLPCAGGESVGVGRVEDRDLRHPDAGGLRVVAHALDEPLLGVVSRLG